MGLILSGLFLSLMFYLFQQHGKKEAFKEMQDKKMRDDIANLKRKSGRSY
jgi:hypothetical protein